MKKPLVISVVLAVVVIGVVVIVSMGDPLFSSQRRTWKANRISEISKAVSDPGWPSREFTLLKSAATAASEDSDAWLSDRIILMGNGEWLAYANTCRKEDSGIYDFFLARGSDGQWYYSTYHFCKGMIVLRAEEQSKSLAEFAKAYYLHSFDGRSDECLRKTWPPSSGQSR